MENPQAFPVAYTMHNEREGYSETVHIEGMTLRDYFIAHAPVDPWPIFKPGMPTPRPTPGVWKSTDGTMNYATRYDAERACGEEFYCANQEALDAWDADYKWQSYAQWPAYWADAMLKARIK